MDSIYLHELQPLTDQEKKMIEHAKTMPITFDADSPESTSEMLHQFCLAAEKRNNMRNKLRYKGYSGSVAHSEADHLFYGKVLGIHSLISYEGKDEDELLKNFHGAVDDYLEVCKAEGKEPETAI